MDKILSLSSPWKLYLQFHFEASWMATMAVYFDSSVLISWCLRGTWYLISARWKDLAIRFSKMFSKMIHFYISAASFTAFNYFSCIDEVLKFFLFQNFIKNDSFFDLIKIKHVYKVLCSLALKLNWSRVITSCLSGCVRIIKRYRHGLKTQIGKAASWV